MDFRMRTRCLYSDKPRSEAITSLFHEFVKKRVECYNESVKEGDYEREKKRVYPACAGDG